MNSSGQKKTNDFPSFLRLQSFVVELKLLWNLWRSEELPEVRPINGELVCCYADDVVVLLNQDGLGPSRLEQQVWT